MLLQSRQRCGIFQVRFGVVLRGSRKCWMRYPDFIALLGSTSVWPLRYVRSQLENV
jgi:hypothetical protein